ncbi:unnamed protein product [Ectocarpus sp. 12 AP-2014]
MSSPLALDSSGSEPRVRRAFSGSCHPPLLPPPDNVEYIQPLQDAPPSRSISHTPPLPPTDSQDGGRTTFDPLEDFSHDTSNLNATDGCLAAVCSLLQFQIAEVWTYTGEISAAEGKPLEPMCLHVYARPATIESFKDVHGALKDDNTSARHSLSPGLVDEARKQERLLWFTSVHPDTPLHTSLPLNTAVALPISLSVLRRDLCFVFFAEHDVNRQDTAVSVLTQLSKAAGVAISASFPAYAKEDGSGSPARKSQTPGNMSENAASPNLPLGDAPLNLDVRWEQLTTVEFMVNGSRCTIYTAFYGTTPVVVKVMRKDVQDRDTVRQELELEMGLLMRLRHPNIVRLLGAGTRPEPFLLIERLDGGTLAQRCGNAVKVRDRRRRFRHIRQFTYEELLRQGLQLAEALQYMHNEAMPGKLVVHRDLKPDNIGFDAQGNLKLIDLGLGRVVSKAADDKATYQMTGETGSLRYMAPEVALGKPYNGSADVYGFAMILWEMATMTKPFEMMGREQFLQQVVEKGVRPRVSEKWPAPFVKLLQSGWHHDMHKRMSIGEITTTLRSLLEAAATAAAQARSVERAPTRKFHLFKSSSRKLNKSDFPA